ncbi:hypothetical protein Tco_1051494 [Tanacetum coccineum]
MNRIDSWKPMVDKFNKKLSCWKAKLLSIGGWLTLLKSVMGSLAIYYMSIYKVPATVLKMLESLRARFFWGADLGEEIALDCVEQDSRGRGIKVGIGDKTFFWRNQWIGDRPLMEQFPRLFPLDPNPDAKVGALQEFIFSEVPDRTGESTEHLFYSCPDLCPLWHRIAVWWGVTTPMEMTFKSIVTWADDVALDAKSKQVFDAVILVAFWIIWSFRNKLIFGTIKPRKDDIFKDIQSVSYFWISNRRKKCKMP